MTDRELMQQALEALEQIKQETFHPAKVFAHNHAVTALRERLAQPEQEPFCYHDGHNIVGKEYADHSDVFLLYTAPRQWQGLTEEEMRNATQAMDAEPLAEGWSELVKFARAIEAKLKEKNT